MNTRLLSATIAAPVALTLAVTLSACSSSSSTVDGQGSRATAASSAPTGSSNVGGGSSSAPTTSAAAPSSSSGSSAALSLAARLGHGLAQARTAHLTLDIDLGGQDVVAHGDEQLSNGKLVALDLRETVTRNFAIRLITVRGKSYVRLPSSLNHSGKPWQLVSAKSSDATVRGFASSLASTRSSASLNSVTALVSAARSVKQTASAGSNTTYSVDIDPAKLPRSYAGRKALVASGLTSVPLTVELDSAGRPVRVMESLTVAGHKVSSKVTLGSYNKPVHITAPPAKQISRH